MEQLVKQNRTLKSRRVAFTLGDNAKYRKLIIRLLAELDDACIELIEWDEHLLLGQRDAQLTGQIVVHDPSFYKDVIMGGSIGAAEAFIDGKWTSPNLTKLIQVMARNQAKLDEIESKMAWLSRIKNLFIRQKNSNTQQGSKRNILAHYDIGNELYQRFLDNSMLYSCAVYSDEAKSLAEAQQNKMRTICEKLALKESDHVIEIGTGWGGLAIYMATHYGCQVTTTTISEAQHEFAQQSIIKAGLSDKITLLKQDYRLLQGQYDKLVSIEMIEAVGHEYLPTFFDTCNKLLKADGKMLLQAITISDARYDKYRKSTDFIQKYIFPGGCLPSVAVMAKHLAERTDMVICDIEDIGLHYARTLNDWRIAFEQRWTELAELGYSDTFKRLWLFYFCYCEGAFKERVISTHHIVSRKPRYLGAGDETVLDY
ncbi:cyclopropane-fatty-acyl-phospholipid synthase family protein [Shewanella sp. Isolate11]|uniref:SAM-dependent methyltransferase n=1 Tax=Shewanella sp. Isolate11 TaxID=2908530 RepID=UPI001EFCD462|nr:cyclopropane-fatty-acyl-phospholipid synthase family protein [Shewanella sp. Isolate11]MCG9697079.1 cyclopropane-fatty-acyl-phospholipid synthase family protein [Shewanella sp. Isolate11]